MLLGCSVSCSALAQTVVYTLSCPGVVSTDATVDPGAPICTNGSGAAVQWQAVPPFDVSQLDYGQAEEAFAAAFVIVGTCWAIGKAVALVFDAIRKS